MKREDLEKLGLSKEQIDSVCDLNNADMVLFCKLYDAVSSILF